MKVVLVDVKRPLVMCWWKTCRDVPGVTVHEGSIFEIECDALVSPANSFGFMDGGLDLAISRFFGWHVQERLQERIRTRHHGELLVGQAELVPTDHPKIPWVISAPTMRVPLVLGPTVNPYLAMRAVLLLVLHGHLDDGRPVREVIETVAVPGLGTGVGRVPSGICARQMRAALGEALLGEAAFPATWGGAKTRHDELAH
jgi:O-acetyl-ADP-ribose deacetylase (regulator of RNase III)